MSNSSAAKDLPPSLVPYQLLSKRQVCNLMSISRTTVNRMLRVKKGPPSVKISGQRRFRLDKLLEWLDMQEEGNHD